MNPPADVVHRPEEANPDSTVNWRLKDLERRMLQAESCLERIETRVEARIRAVETKIWIILAGVLGQLLYIVLRGGAR